MLNLFASQDQNIKNDVLSGITVALALVPESVAFAFVAGVSPVIGLYSAFFLGFVTAIFGGRPGMISGATGAMAVVVVTLVAQYGIEYLFPAVILAGALQIIVGLCRLGMLIRMVPHPVMLGFVNGLAIVIFTAQFGSFKSINGLGQLAFISGPALWIMLTLIGLTMSIIWLLPKFTRALPASLIAILFVTALSVVLNSSLDSRYAAENQSRVVLTVRDMLVSNATAAATADRAIEIDFYYTRVYDQSGLEAINSLAEKYEQQGKRLHLTHLSPECRDLLDRAGDLVEVNVSEDPQYHVATDRMSRAEKKNQRSNSSIGKTVAVAAE